MSRILSVNVGTPIPNPHDHVPVTGIDKRPVTGPVSITDPGAVQGGAGLAGDSICDVRHHGAHDQAVYAYAREDLDWWERELGRQLRCGVFGENLTTQGLDLTAAQVGEQWLVGDACVLQVTSPRIPCRTFAGWLAERRWQRRFTERGQPGAYLRVLVPGSVRAGDELRVTGRPGHEVTVGFMFRALTTEQHLIPRLAVAGSALDADTRRRLG